MEHGDEQHYMATLEGKKIYTSECSALQSYCRENTEEGTAGAHHCSLTGSSISAGPQRVRSSRERGGRNLRQRTNGSKGADKKIVQQLENSLMWLEYRNSGHRAWGGM